MKTTFRRSALASALALALSQAYAAPVDLRSAVPAQRPDIDTIAVAATMPDLLILRAGAYDPATQRLDLGLSAAADVVSSRYAIVQFHVDSVETGRAQLQKQGVAFVGYVPNNAYIVRLNGTNLDALKRSTGVRAAEAYAAGHKIDPRLWTDVRAQLVQQEPEDAPDSHILLDIVNVRGFQGESSAQIEAALRKLVPDVRITARSQRADAMPYVHAGVARGQLDALLRAASALGLVAAGGLVYGVVLLACGLRPRPRSARSRTTSPRPAREMAPSVAQHRCSTTTSWAVARSWPWPIPARRRGWPILPPWTRAQVR